MFAVYKVTLLHQLKNEFTEVFVREKTGPQNKAIKFRFALVPLLNRSDRKK